MERCSLWTPKVLGHLWVQYGQNMTKPCKKQRLQRGCPSLQSKCLKIEAAALNDWRSILRKYSQNCSFLIQILLCAHSKMTCCSLWKFAHATWIQIESTFSKDAFSMAMWLCWFLASVSIKKSDLVRHSGSQTIRSWKIKMWPKTQLPSIRFCQFTCVEIEEVWQIDWL